ncbi:malonyl CoA-acyl carrier protein transacylase [Tistrella bauzanensis]|uniref:Malonyl CoA-acyl carrier protein transacylase n=1 Tax=Tistrella bauzanensis TaxID=657419 RepID=A0ABQ1IR98_9PROT|nr:ACP S-malonyltransferase [Tistrella bauzanensis]GGB50556.1 malonyl CoA-acyl carrier protein transacylase [Tistrella bauzanensis]
MARAFVFPGQGSQKVGMGQDLAAAFAAAREVFEEVDEALKQPLTRLMFDGPAETLVLTENAQPAIMACSMAVVRVLEQQGGLDIATQAAFVAGHSLGEYSALCAAGALDIGDTARLLKIRGQAMQLAVPVGVGAMLALMGVDPDEARAIADEASASGEVCVVANDNAPGQVVLSGHKSAIDRAVEIGKARGKRTIPLEVSAPFHCPLMKPAADRMADALAQVEIDAPRLPLIANVLAEPVSDPDRIRGLLVDQVTGVVRWRESVLFMKSAGVEETVELGAGKVLSGLTKRIDRAVAARSVGTPAEIEAFLTSL